MALVTGVAFGACAGPAEALRQLTGAPTRVVWLQDQGDGSDAMARGDRLALMGFDTEDGRGERRILTAEGRFHKPLLTPDGQRVVVTDTGRSKILVVGFDGQALHDVADGFAADVWADPATGLTWVYAQTPTEETRHPIRRYLLDQPAQSELVWDKSPVGIDNFQLSADGTRASALLPWPNACVVELPNIGSDRFGGGCWVSMAPDNRYLAWVFDGAHRNIELHGLGEPRKVSLTGAPGIDGWEVYHPRWSNHPRVMAMTGPYRQGGMGRNNIRGGGPAVELYAGRFDSGYTCVEAWARITRNERGDFFPDIWVAGGENATPAAAARPAAEPGAEAPALGKAWPGSHEGLVFLWESLNRPNRVRDTAAGVDRSCRAFLRGRAIPAAGGAVDLAGGALVAEDADAALLEACRRSNQLAVEVTIVPANVSQSGPARIVSFSSTPASRNFTLGQDRDQLVLRLRTPRTGGNGVNPQVTLCRLEAGRRRHVLVSYQPGRLLAFLDGRQVLATGDVQGDFSNWSPQHLVCGDEYSGERDWSGTLEGVAIGSRFVGPEEAAARYRLMSGKLAARKPVPRLVVEARLATKLPAPGAAMLEAYRRSLSLCEYDVTRVIEGACGDVRIAVAHWSLLDRQPVPSYEARKVGETYRLELAPFEARPELDGERRFEELSDPGLPVFACDER